MANPKFAVGEVVILQSTEYPEFNGEHVVESIISPGERGRDDYNGGKVFGYYLSPSHLVRESQGEAMWSERVIRKRHQPGDYTWDGLKTVLHNPISREEHAALSREVCRG
jgi:hypothetical protein